MLQLMRENSGFVTVKYRLWKKKYCHYFQIVFVFFFGEIFELNVSHLSKNNFILTGYNYWW